MNDMKTTTASTYVKNVEDRFERFTYDDFNIKFRLQYYGANKDYEADNVYTLFTPVISQILDSKGSQLNITVLPIEEKPILTSPVPPSR